MKTTRVLGFVLLLLMSAVAGLYYYMSHSAESSKIQISTNPWIGFTPFIYAQEKGWLEKTPFRFMWLVDLTDNARLYERGFTQGFTATQYELLHFKHANTIKPVFLIDRSFGADAIVSNCSIDEIRFSKERVEVYMEQGSLQDDFFKAFIAEYSLDSSKFHKMDVSQKNITTIEVGKRPMLIISYEPYLSELLKKGFQPIASTRTMDSFFVIDALFADERVVLGREKEFAHLHELFGLAVEHLNSNPREYYETIKGYLEGQSYEEFMVSTHQIEWIYRKAPKEIIAHLNAQHVKTDRLLP
ncbi:MAG: hypothetical protein PHQ90_01410 [Sulfuricurvum sp.]|uniref:hypothetical protein n=1 Tax=Sulfuricurvum sp. TaxID=2025608 RepID=UPI0026391567|nr:hypothetical protein [Sulfuricurvum sp.]MDD2367926.1 hypothetical protein [Sulfuricurvum sp.]MDD2949343.1 hypothetical protein [Sulfuricurvum sp.]MDD5117739.1 hypothetical protein [Sulfuricurvum sp.]